MPHNPDTLAALRSAVCARGPLTFADFMQIALYDPQSGYYRRAKIGRHGDFMTAVSAGPVFGRIWARHFRKLLGGDLADFHPVENNCAENSTGWKESQHEIPSDGNQPKIYEFGGNDGRFRDDVLAECPELKYQIIEADEPMPEKMEGIVFSNELIDALPFHRLRIRDGKWRELFIGHNGRDELCESEGEPSLDLRQVPEIPDDWEIELRPAAENWIRGIAARLARGYVITIDYGMTREEYFSKPRPKGTLRCYHKHTQNDNPLANVGEQDITADVDFTGFIAAGEASGLETILFADQAHVLLEIGREVIEEITTRDAGKFSKDRNAIHQLLHPSLMGRRFKVLIQRKT